MKRLVLLSLLSLTACSSGVTEVVVTLDAQSQVAAMSGDVHVIVRGGPASGATYDSPSALDITVPVGAGANRQFPLQVTVAPRGGDASRRWAVDAMAVQSGTSTVIATARVHGSFVEGNTLRIGLVLEDACLNVVCDADQTCRGSVCVDATYVTLGTDAGPSDAGIDSGDAAVDAAFPQYCPGADVYSPNADAGSLRGDGGVPLTYPAPVPCPVVHARDAPCTGTPELDDICFTESHQIGAAFCRVPCGTDNPDGGTPILDENRCQAIHHDSHCVATVAGNIDPNQYMCTEPCNPLDDVGCAPGLHCQLIAAYDDRKMITECSFIDPLPRHMNEACEVVGGDTEPSYDGCAPGYFCSWTNICGDPMMQGYGCLQICDRDPVSPILECPSGSYCYDYTTAGYEDLVGGLHLGVCYPN